MSGKVRSPVILSMTSDVMSVSRKPRTVSWSAKGMAATTIGADQSRGSWASTRAVKSNQLRSPVARLTRSISRSSTVAATVMRTIAKKVPETRLAKRENQRRARVGIATTRTVVQTTTARLTARSPVSGCLPPRPKRRLSWSSQMMIAIPFMKPEITTLGMNVMKRPSRRRAAVSVNPAVRTRVRFRKWSEVVSGNRAARDALLNPTTAAITVVMGPVGPLHCMRVPPRAEVIDAMRAAENIPAKAPRPERTPKAAPSERATKLTVSAAIRFLKIEVRKSELASVMIAALVSTQAAQGRGRGAGRSERRESRT